MIEVARLTNEGELKLAGEINERLPAITDGLIAHYPFDGIASGTSPTTNLTDYNAFVVGSGSPWGSNGATEKTTIVEDVDPFGKVVPIMQAYNTDATSTSDGGWSSKGFAVDPNYDYKISTWIRRTVVGDGTFYFGVGGNTVRTLSSGALNSNPYMKTLNGTTLTKDDWFLVVTYIQKYSTPNGSPFISDGGVYDVNGNKITTCTDYKWAEATTVWSTTRSYLYYSTIIGTTQQWAYPTVYKVDGTEPSVQDMLEGRTHAINPSTNTNTTLTDDGIAVEESTTNLITDPMDFESSSWSKEGFVGSVSNASDYIKSGVVGKIQSTSGWFYFRKNDCLPNTTYTFSIWMKGIIDIENKKIGIWCYNGSSGSGLRASSSLTNLQRGLWTKLEVTYITASDETDLSFTVSGTSGIGYMTDGYIACPQVEAKPFATSFVDGTRSGGSMKIPFGDNFVNTSEGSLVVKLNPTQYVNSPTGYSDVLDFIPNESGSNRFIILRHEATKDVPARMFIRHGGGWVSVPDIPIIPNEDNILIWTWSVESGYSNMYLNGVNVKSTSGYSPTTSNFDYLDVKKNNTIKHLSLYNKSLSTSEVKLLTSQQMNLQENGDMICDEIDERPVGIPSGANYFPLGFDGKDEYKIIEPVNDINTVYENGDVWIGNSLTNASLNDGQGGVIPWSGDGGVTYSAMDDLTFRGRKVAKMTLGTSGNCYINGGVDLSTSVSHTDWTATSYVKRVDGLPLTTVGSYLYDSANATANINAEIELVEDGWYKVTRKKLGLVSCYPTLMGWNGFGSGTSIYIADWQVEPNTFSSQYTSSTRGDSKLHLPYGIIDCKQDFTIYGWWKPSTYADGLYRPCLTRNRLSGSITGNRILIMGNGTVSYQLRAWLGSGGIAEASIFASATVPVIVNEWNFFTLRRSGANMSLSIGNSGGFNVGSSYVDYASKLDTDEDPLIQGWMIGQYDLTAHTSNAYHRDYVFEQSALSDAEIEAIFKNKLNQYSDKIQVLNQVHEGEVF